MYHAHPREHAELGIPDTAQDAARIPALSHDEAAYLAFAEFIQYLALVESLAYADWSKPTACTLLGRAPAGRARRGCCRRLYELV